jgi:hypothetical protein
VFELTDKTGVATLGHNGEVVVVAILHDLAELLCCFRLDHDGTLAVILVHPVVIIHREVVGRCGPIDRREQRGGGGEETADRPEVVLCGLGECRGAVGKGAPVSDRRSVGRD